VSMVHLTPRFEYSCSARGEGKARKPLPSNCSECKSNLGHSPWTAGALV
jgi:hypothetical protein